MTTQAPASAFNLTEQSSAPRVRFCTICGGALRDGACVRCRPSAPRRGRKVAPVVVGCALALISGLLHRSLSELRGQVTHLTTELESQERLHHERAVADDHQSAAIAAASERVAALETAASERAPDTSIVAAKIAPSVFTVTAAEVSGSAWVVSSAGGASRLITNYHVVSEAWKDQSGAVQLHEGERVWDATVVDVSEGSDLAVIEVAAGFPALKQAEMPPSVGDPVIAAGAPLGLDDSVSTGIVSAIRTEGVDDYIQFSAPVSPGSSGGPLVNQNGEVLGVTVMKAVAEGAEGLGFAIPASLVCDVVSC